MRALLYFIFFVITCSAQAQLNPVAWSFEVEQIGEKEFEVTFTADIAHGWSVYSQHLDPNAGPIPTSFEFTATSTVKTLGQTEETGNKEEGFDEIFGVNLIKYTGRAKFTQRFTASTAGQYVKGKLTYMTCNGKSCLPPTDVPFDIPLK